MSENTLTLSLPAAKAAAKITQSAVGDPVAAWNGANGDYAKASKSWAAAYVQTGALADDVELGRTVLAALVVKALDAEASAKKPGAKATADKIASTLEYHGMNSALPGQWRTVARMVTDLGMVPTAPVTRWLTSAKPKGLAAAVKDAKSAKDVESFAEKVATAPRVRERLGFAPLPEVTTGGDAPNTSDNSNAGGADTTTRGAGAATASEKDTTPVTRAQKFARIETYLADLGSPLDASEWALLFRIHAGIESVLDASDQRAEGQRVAAKA